MENMEKFGNILENSIKNGKIFHSYILVGLGADEMAKKFAKKVLCLNSASDECKSCLEFDSGNNPDFMEIEPDGNSIKIDQIREMNKKILEKPIVSNRKVYIINKSDLMTPEAQNSLLKTLEEPPEYACIILVCANENSLLDTIKSRCLEVKFNSNDEQLEKYGKYETIKYDIINLENLDLIGRLKAKDKIFANKDDAIEILEYINTIFFEQINVGVGVLDNPLKYLEVGADASVRPNKKYAKTIALVEDTKERLKRNNNFDMTIDRFLINFDI